MNGANLIQKERVRQIDDEKFIPSHDASHVNGELVDAAHCYLNAKRLREVFYSEDAVPLRWPWEDEWWKPTPEDRIRELVKAGALIAAEIDRLLALQYKSTLKIEANEHLQSTPH